MSLKSNCSAVSENRWRACDCSAPDQSGASTDLTLCTRYTSLKNVELNELDWKRLVTREVQTQSEAESVPESVISLRADINTFFIF